LELRRAAGPAVRLQPKRNDRSTSPKYAPDPAAQDIAAFQDQLTNKQIKVLIYTCRRSRRSPSSSSTSPSRTTFLLLVSLKHCRSGRRRFKAGRRANCKLLLNPLQTAAAQ